ncbi:MAG: 50S ribosomal protein L4 [Victivallaceae bacterium]|nr:50S ribosomal protein L4 [Victivallaceae bacterium]MDD3703081.1 50S ribosomal protein L4 [Victivallaceae bacterium]MDD5663705.1 50S ribosomal protein L4 [Victivallaceae bacterium]
MSIKLDIFDMSGAVVGNYELPEAAIELEKGKQAVHDTVVAFLAEQRAGSACTKTRAEVRGGGAKPFRQKGTGRARAGSNRSPIWTGGGVTFGPKPRSYDKKVNAKVKTLALRRAFSERIQEGSVLVVDKFELQDHKTQSAVAVFKNLKVDGSALLTVPDYEESVVCATNNLADVVLRKVTSVNVYEMLRFGKIVFTKEALDEFIKRIA